ncbi:MAG: hypothetical protein NXH82_01160 [Rhodobacteraceae bacterium]|nr:hypothetical protein [Paracoccaceae bacterium]
MIDIYARAFMTATRTGQVELRDYPRPNQPARSLLRRWLKPAINVDPGRL